MRVKISETVEVSDEQRRAIAQVYDAGVGKKRDATREEMKEFIWDHGLNWESVLNAEPAPGEAEDLLGVAEDPMDLI